MNSTCLQTLDFQRVQAADFAKIIPFFQGKGLIAAEYSALYIFMWGGYLGIEYAISDGVLFLRRNNRFGVSYHPPMAMGRPIAETLSALSRLGGDTVRLCGVPAHLMDEVESAVTVLEKGTSRRWADYVYSAEELATLAGKKFSKKRNLVHQFERLYPDHTYECLGGENEAEVAAFLTRMMGEGEYTEDERYENQRVLDVLADYNSLPLCGGVVRVAGQIVSFCVGEVIDRTLVVHIEKADRAFKGAYQYINYRFVGEQRALTPFLLVNREDDTGDEGLRQAKLSYFPVQILHKYHLVLKNEFGGAV
jgi:hypothetical protein